MLRDVEAPRVHGRDGLISEILVSAAQVARRSVAGGAASSGAAQREQTAPSDQPAQDLRGLPAQAPLSILKALSIPPRARPHGKPRRMAAGPRRSNPRAAVTVRIAGKVDDVIR